MMDRLLQHSLVYGSATILARGTLVVALLVLPFILAPAEYGALAMIATLTALTALVVPLEIAQGLARFYPGASKDEKPGYASTAWWFTLAMLVLFVVLAEAAAGPLNRLILGDDAYLGAFRIAITLTALSCLFYFLQGQCRWEFRPGDFVLVSLVFSFLTLALSLLLGALADNALLGVVAGQLIGAAIAVVLAAWRLRRSLTAAPVLPKLREMLGYSLPLVPAGIAMIASAYGSRIVLNWMASLEAVGLFTFASQIAGIASLVIVGVQAALTPLVMAHHHEPETPAAIARFFEGFTVLALCLCLALGLFAPEAILYFGNPSYLDAAPLVLILAPSLIALQMYIFAPGFAVARKTHIQMWVSIAAAGFGLAANVALIPLWGIMGAALATLLGAAAFIGAWFVLSHKFYPVPVRWRRMTLVLLATAAGAAGALAGDYPDLLSALIVKSLVVVIVFGLGLGLGLLPFRTLLTLAKGRLSGSSLAATS